MRTKTPAPTLYAHYDPFDLSDGEGVGAIVHMSLKPFVLELVEPALRRHRVIVSFTGRATYWFKSPFGADAPASSGVALNLDDFDTAVRWLQGAL